MKTKFTIIILCLFLLVNNFYGQNSSKDYKGGELYSNDTVLFGKFEVRARLVSENGIVSSFFLYDNVSWQGAPHPWREIDIESLGKEKNSFQTNLITGFADKRITSEKIDKIEKLDAMYHTFTVEWTPDYIAWLIDDKLIRKDTADKNLQIVDLRDTPQTYRMNLWISNQEEWAGKLDKNVLPVYQYVNWIKYYEYTPGKGKNKSNFTLKWTDNFDSFDSKRWGKGDWSFEGNLVDFSFDNILVKDGYLIICLTTKDKIGFQGKLVLDDKK